jgi:ribonuclease BN (tRNA processing enzyme)
VQPERLVLFHLSDRYTPADWQEQLAEIRRVFPGAMFPQEWTFDA